MENVSSAIDYSTYYQLPLGRGSYGQAGCQFANYKRKEKDKTSTVRIGGCRKNAAAL